MKTTTTTYWKENRTGIIYKYEFGTEPYRSTEAWTRVTGWEYDKQMADALWKYSQK